MGNLIDDQWLQTVSNIKHIHPKVGCRRRDYFSARGELTPVQLRLQVNPHRSVEVGGDGDEVGNVLICKGHIRRYFQHAHFIPIVGVGKRGEYY